MKRHGEMVMIKPEGLEAYKRYHANPLPGVNEMIKACNIRNYSIYQHGDYMFAYYEYVGDDFEADMAKMAADPVTQEWWGSRQAFDAAPDGQKGRRVLGRHGGSLSSGLRRMSIPRIMQGFSYIMEKSQKTKCHKKVIIGPFGHIESKQGLRNTASFIIEGSNI